MSDVIPSIFTKADFWAMLLPGYVTVILGLVIFYPGMFGFFESKSGLPFDILSIVVFIVAGPAVGFLLWQIYFHVSSLAKFSITSFNKKYEFQRAYESLRLVCSIPEKDELSSIDGRYIFGFSTAVGLTLISLYALAVVFFTPDMMPCNKVLFDEQSLLCKDDIQGYLIILILVITSTVLAVGSYFENKRARLLVICNLIKNYKECNKLQIDMPTTCKIRFLKIQEKIDRTAFNIIKDFLYDRKIKNIKNNNTKLTDGELIDLLEKDVTFQGDRKMATDIINKFKTNHVLDLDGYLNKKNLNRMHHSSLSHHLIHRRIRSVRLWWRREQVER